MDGPEIKLDLGQRARANAILAQVADEPEWAAASIVIQRDWVEERDQTIATLTQRAEQARKLHCGWVPGDGPCKLGDRLCDYCSLHMDIATERGRAVAAEKLAVWAVRKEARLFVEHQDYKKPLLFKGQHPLQATIFVIDTDADLLRALAAASAGGETK